MMERHTAVYNSTGKLKRVLLAKPTYYKVIPLSDIALDFYGKGVKPDQNRYTEWVIRAIKDETEDNAGETFCSDGYGKLESTKISNKPHRSKTDPDAKPARKSHTTTTLPHLDNYLMNNKHWKNIMRH